MMKGYNLLNASQPKGAPVRYLAASSYSSGHLVPRLFQCTAWEEVAFHSVTVPSSEEASTKWKEQVISVLRKKKKTSLAKKGIMAELQCCKKIKYRR